MSTPKMGDGFRRIAAVPSTEMVNMFNRTRIPTVLTTPETRRHRPFTKQILTQRTSQRSRITSHVTDRIELEAGKAIPMITIHRSTTGRNSKVRVTFEMPAADHYDGLYLVGWFNEWDETVYRMERTTDGKWTLTLELEPGCEYQYRYRTTDGRWLQDPTPAPAQFGLNSSFLVTSDSMA